MNIKEIINKQTVKEWHQAMNQDHNVVNASSNCYHECEQDKPEDDSVMKVYVKDSITSDDDGWVVYKKGIERLVAYMYVSHIGSRVLDVRFFAPQTDPGQDEVYELDPPDRWIKLDVSAYLASKQANDDARTADKERIAELIEVLSDIVLGTPIDDCNRDDDGLNAHPRNMERRIERAKSILKKEGVKW